MSTKLPHCAVLARQLGERPTGTAPRIRSVLLVEHAGPWAADVRDRILTECFGPSGPARIDELNARYGLRALLIRRPGRRPPPERPAVFVGGLRPRRRWLERLSVDRYANLADLDLAAVATGDGGFGAPESGPKFLVCVHGRKDACCAILGRPVADALAAQRPDQTWQCTHFGGDRWAGNMLAAPHGFMYGQLTPVTVAPVAASVAGGRVCLENLRGRVGTHPFSQIAEIAVRERTGLTGLDAVLAGNPRRDGPAADEATVEVHAGSAAYLVRVSRSPLGVHGRSSCAGETRPYRFEVLDVADALTAPVR